MRKLDNSEAIQGHHHMHKIFTFFLTFLLFSQAAYAEDYSIHNPQPFGLWVQELKLQANKQRGVPEDLLFRAFKGVRPSEKIIRLDRKQPEGTTSFTDYIAKIIDNTRISKGRKLYKQHMPLLQQVSAQYGVEPEYIIALWGAETNYGGYTGNTPVVQALATLAYDGRRSDFFRGELLDALTILKQGHISESAMEGSWAGAMGQSQFMPSSFLAYAVDYNGDGRRDIWNTQEDVFASISNYLKERGWKTGIGWGGEAIFPAGFDVAKLDESTKPAAAWAALGVKWADGKPLTGNQPLRLVLPGEAYEKRYLVTPNYDVILRWNRSQYFATSIGLLADAVKRP